MTIQGYVKAGQVHTDRPLDLPDGTAVEIIAPDDAIESLSDLPAFGMWRDRTDLGDSGEASLTLRARAERRNGDG